MAKNHFADSLNLLKKDLKKHYMLYLFILPALLVIVVFSYVPMYGLQIAFKDFKPALGIMNSEWVGFDNFARFFSSYKFVDILTNTLSLSVYCLVACFPVPIILALAINQVSNKKVQKTVQTITYMPHFISMVVVTGMVIIFMNPTSGLYGNLMRAFGILKPEDLLGKPQLFGTIYVISDIWQHTGWDSIIYLAALSGIDVSLHEAATVDGAGEWQKIRYIDFPSLLPTAIVLLILNCGNLMNLGFEKVYMLQNSLNLPASEIIATYVFKVGINSQQYSFSAAIGLFNSVINLILLLGVNYISKKVTDYSLI